MTLHIVLGPSGVGKSAFVSRAQRDDPTLRYLDRDGLAKTLIGKRGIDFNLSEGRDSTLVSNDVLRDELDEHYFRELEHLLEKPSADIFIDYCPSMEMGWVEETVQKAVSCDLEVRLIGIFAQPALILKRVIERNAFGVDLKQDTTQILDDDKAYFRAWLNTYRIFPKQFFSAVNPYIGDVEIWDNTRNYQLVANWKGQGVGQERDKTILDESLYFNFQKLSLIQPQESDFSTSLIDSVFEGGKYSHSFDVEPTIIYRA